MKKFIVVLSAAAFAFVCLVVYGCEDKNASKRKAELVPGGKGSFTPVLEQGTAPRPAIEDNRISRTRIIGNPTNRMLPDKLCGGMPQMQKVNWNRGAVKKTKGSI